jgi:putative membrane protein
MKTASQILTGLVALLHFYILVLEMFLWATPRGAKAFKRTLQQQADTKVLAANQGLYNGFLAAGLVWAVFAGAPFGYALKLFFLGCVVVAGIFGAATASRRILVFQALPGALAFVATLLAGAGE